MAEQSLNVKKPCKILNLLSKPKYKPWEEEWKNKNQTIAKKSQYIFLGWLHDMIGSFTVTKIWYCHNYMTWEMNR